MRAADTPPSAVVLHAGPSAGLADVEAGPREVRRVIVLCVAYALIAAMLLPFLRVELVALPHFASLFGLAVLVADVCTYLLLVSLFGTSGARWLLQLSTAYLFSAFMAALHVLTYPGAFLPEGPIIGASKTVGWLYAAWNLGFTALLLAAIAAIPGAATTERTRRRREARLTAVVVALVVAALTGALVASDAILPAPVVGDRFSAWSLGMNYLRGALALCAFVLIVATPRRHRLVALWLSLALVAATVGPVLTDLGGRRYTFGWYAGRASFVFASYTLLAVLLMEFVKLQNALAAAVGRLETKTNELTTEVRRRELAERKLVTAERLNAIGQLASGVAHDFNNLLTAIVANLEVIVRRTADGDVRQCADGARQAALRGARLTRSLLAFGRRQPLQNETIETEELIDSALLLLRGAAGAQLEIVFEPGASTWRCEADPAQLEVALLNLVINARDAMPVGGRVVIATRNVVHRALVAVPPDEVKPGDYVEISVRDSGVGIAAGLHERVFEPFFTTKQPGSGAGLGLSQVKGFAQQSQGDVSIESAEGHGTVVRLLLPRAASAVGDSVVVDADAA